MTLFERSLERKREIVRLNYEIARLNKEIVELVRIARINEDRLFDSPVDSPDVLTKRQLQRRWIPSSAVVDGKEISSGG